MMTVCVTKRIPVPAAAAWNVIRTGTDVERWFPAVTSCRLEGEGPGAKRTCVVNGHELLEAIETIDDANRLFQYRILKQSMMPTRNVVGTLHLTAVGPSETEVLWFANLEVDDQSAWPIIKDAIEGMYHAGIDGLQAHVRGR